MLINEMINNNTAYIFSLMALATYRFQKKSQKKKFSKERITKLQLLIDYFVGVFL